MLLRRLMEHIRKLDWFMVSVDLLVLTVGIFLGMQVSEWNEERKARAEEFQYLERLNDDIMDSISQNDFRIDFMERQDDYAEVIRESLSNCILRPEDEFAFTSGLYIIGKEVPPVFVNGVFEELQSTGKFQIISNSAIRKALAQHMQGILETADIDGKILLRQTPHIHNIEKNIIYNITSPRDGTADIEVGDLSYDFNALCQDASFLQSLSHVRAYSQDVIFRIQIAKQQQLVIKAMIEAEMEKAR